MAIWYLDTSAFLKLLVDEEHSASLRSFAEKVELWSSSLLAVEAHRAGPRLDLDVGLVNQVLASVTMVVPSEATFASARFVGTPELRTLDALHLASALEFAGDLDGVLTYDRRLGAGCDHEHLAVAAPGLPAAWWR